MKKGIKSPIDSPSFDYFKGLIELIPKDSYAPINLKEYAEAIDYVYSKKIPENASEEEV
jgi:hypothetical protein